MDAASFLKMYGGYYNGLCQKIKHILNIFSISINSYLFLASKKDTFTNIAWLKIL